MECADGFTLAVEVQFDSPPADADVRRRVHTALVIDPGADEIFGEQVAFSQEVVIFFQRLQCFLEGFPGLRIIVGSSGGSS
ncbi:MAG: hypothetical protein U1U88_002314 [Lawsonella clevelandensis]